MKRELCTGVGPIPPLVAHRGASHRAPENTLPAYRLAWQEGADRIEGDFWLTADGQLVCIHDPTTERTAPGQEPVDVRKAEYMDLKRYDVGGWKSPEFMGTGIPTLAEILAEMPEDTIIYVEIKQDEPEIVTALLEVVNMSPVNMDRITLIAFSPDIVRQTKRMVPEMRVLLLYDLDGNDSDNAAVPTVDELLSLAGSIRADGLGLGNSARIDEHFVSRLRAAGLEFHVWTVNNVRDSLRYIRLGVDSITTDRPADLRREIIAHLLEEKTSGGLQGKGPSSCG